MQPITPLRDVALKKETGSPLSAAEASVTWVSTLQKHTTARQAYSYTDITHSKAVQYAKAMGLKVVGIDISNNQLEAVKSLGADITCNSLQEKDYAQRIKKLTNGGCHAAAVFSASIAAYESAPNILR
jgi:uncharacterized protein YbaP (TraB family)